MCTLALGAVLGAATLLVGMWWLANRVWRGGR